MVLGDGGNVLTLRQSINYRSQGTESESPQGALDGKRTNTRTAHHFPVKNKLKVTDTTARYNLLLLPPIPEPPLYRLTTESSGRKSQAELPRPHTNTHAGASKKRNWTGCRLIPRGEKEVLKLIRFKSLIHGRSCFGALRDQDETPLCIDSFEGERTLNNGGGCEDVRNHTHPARHANNVYTHTHL